MQSGSAEKEAPLQPHNKACNYRCLLLHPSIHPTLPPHIWAHPLLTCLPPPLPSNCLCCGPAALSALCQPPSAPAPSFNQLTFPSAPSSTLCSSPPFMWHLCGSCGKAPFNLFFLGHIIFIHPSSCLFFPPSRPVNMVTMMLSSCGR